KGSVPQNNGVSGAGHGGLVAAAGTSNVGGSIVAANGASGFGRSFDVDGAFTSNGFNLIGTADNSSGFGATGDQLGSDAAKLNPLFDPNGLRDNGGTTDTVALLSGSPAINTGDNANGPTLDQRSYTRD